MSLRLGLLAALLAGLFAFDRVLDRRGSAARLARVQVRALVPAEQRDKLQVAAFRLRRGELELEYLRTGGIWRCAAAYGAAARTDLVLSFLNGALHAEGVVHSETPERPERYGFDTDETVLLTLHGTQLRKQADEDRLLALEIGRSIPGTDACYVRFPGERAVWAVAVDLTAMLGWGAGNSLPPLLDPYIVPAAWADAAEVILSIVVEPEDRPEFELTLYFPPADEVAQGAPEWQWRLRTGAEEHGIHPVLGVGYTLFLRRAPYIALLPPELAPKVIGERPAARIRMVPRRGAEIEILLGRPRADGNVPAFSTAFGQLFLIEAEVAKLLVPETSALSETEAGNPWDPWLKRVPGGE